MKNQLREKRMQHGWSQAELGDRVGVSRQAIIAIEAGRFDPSLPLALKMARLFNTTVEAMFTLDDES